MVSENNRIKSAQPDDLNCGLEREVGTCAGAICCRWGAEVWALGGLPGVGSEWAKGRGSDTLSTSDGGINSWSLPFPRGCLICCSPGSPQNASPTGLQLKAPRRHQGTEG